MMDRSPIYQTFSTRVLVPVRRRSRRPLALVAAGAAALLLAALLLGRGVQSAEETQGAKAVRVAAPDAVRDDVLRHYREQAATPVAPTSPVATVATMRVAGTEGAGLLLRDAPGFGGAMLVTLGEDAILELRGEQVVADGLLWAPVRDTAGNEGWVAADYLQPA
jgi:hypothetical protein